MSHKVDSVNLQVVAKTAHASEWPVMATDAEAQAAQMGEAPRQSGARPLEGPSPGAGGGLSVSGWRALPGDVWQWQGGYAANLSAWQRWANSFGEMAPAHRADRTDRGEQ